MRTEYKHNPPIPYSLHDMRGNVDELYWYNQVLYSGYLSILGSEDLIQMDISIYFTGKIIYDTKE